MSSAPPRRSALVAAGVAPPGGAAPAVMSTPGVEIREQPYQALVNLRGDVGEPGFCAAVEAALCMAMPAPNRFSASGGRRLAWLGPDEWLVIAEADEAHGLVDALGSRLARQHAAVNDVSAGYAVIELAGPAARGVLAAGCPLDLHPRAFATGRCAGTHVAKAHVLLLQTGDRPTYVLLVRRSYADYLWRWMVDAWVGIAP